MLGRPSLVDLFRQVWFDRFSLVCLVWQFWLGLVGLAWFGLVWFGKLGLVGLVWYVWFGTFGLVGLV